MVDLMALAGRDDEEGEGAAGAGAEPRSNVPEFSVSDLAFALKRTVEEAFPRVRVRGELGRVLIARSGHLYADLKDDKAVIGGVMWKAGVQRLAFKPEEGLEVIAVGKLSTYPGRSQYQLIIEHMEPAGVGALMKLLEERKAKLQAEGLFDEARKKPIPFLPRVVGVVTSPTGAVIRDILHRIADRFPVRVVVWPCLVQGEGAARQIAAGIAGLNALPEGGSVPRPDVIIVARGGGSIEDLWAFNEEVVARAVAESAIPLISAVGHETDTTLIDYVSDRRAPTPTGAAEMAVPVRAQLMAQIEDLGARLPASVLRLVERRKDRLRAAAAHLPRPDQLLGLAEQRLDRAGEKLGRALMAAVQTHRGRFERVAALHRPEAIARDLSQRGRRVEDLGARLRPATERLLRERARTLAQTGKLLKTLSHESALERGFALVLGADGSLKPRAAAVAEGEALRLRFADGEIGAQAGGVQTGPADPVKTAKPAKSPKSPKSPKSAKPAKPAAQPKLFD